MIKDMTVGSPLKIILQFSLPMLLSMMFQQLYNIVDSVVAGNFVSVDALAAVGASYPITVLFIAVATGASIGCSVIVSQLFGAKKLGLVKTAVNTAAISLTALSILLTVAGLFFCNPLMRLMHTPENIFSDSALYLRIYICGIVFLFLYNTATAIFTGLGDSRTPLYFLIFSSLFNIALDLWFVISFQMGVAGVAWATFIAQGISSLLAISTLIRRVRKIHTDEPYQVFDPKVLKRMAIIAIPSILQQSFISVGQLCVQGLINRLGSIVVAGYSAAFKVNTFCVSAITTMSSALSSFAAQNYGAQKISRMRAGLKCAMGTITAFVVVFIALSFLFGHNLIGFFMDAGQEGALEAIQIGEQFLWTVAPFWLLVCVKCSCDGILRGTGAMRGFMASTFTDLILRVMFSFILVPLIGFAGICWSYPIGWFFGTIVTVFVYRRKLDTWILLETPG